jgi:hypothetical protein
MGNSCCSYQPKDQNAKDFNKPESKPSAAEQKELDDLMAHAKENEDKILKI